MNKTLIGCVLLVIALPFITLIGWTCCMDRAEPGNLEPSPMYSILEHGAVLTGNTLWIPPEFECADYRSTSSTPSIKESTYKMKPCSSKRYWMQPAEILSGSTESIFPWDGSSLMADGYVFDDANIPIDVLHASTVTIYDLDVKVIYKDGDTLLFDIETCGGNTVEIIYSDSTEWYRVELEKIEKGETFACSSSATGNKFICHAYTILTAEPEPSIEPAEQPPCTKSGATNERTGRGEIFCVDIYYKGRLK